MLLLESSLPGHGPAKDARIRGDLSTTPVRYYRDLSALIETERAVAFDPLLVARLRGVRDAARRSREAIRRHVIR